MSTLRLLHRWLGLLLAVPMLIQGATGLFMMLAVPIDASLVPTVLPSIGSPHPLAELVAAARELAGPTLVPLRYAAGDDPRDTATIDLALPAQRLPALRFYVDPVSLEVLGQVVQPDAAYRWVHRVHETLLIPGMLGRGIIGWSGIGLLVLAISGAVLWWPRPGRWREALTVPLTARGYRLQRGLHGAAGGWMVAMILLQAASGTSMAFPQTAAALLGTAQVRPLPGARGGSGTVDLAGIETLLAAAAPGKRLQSLRLPTEPGGRVFAALRAPQAAADAPPILVTIDPAAMRVVSARDPDAGPLGGWLLAWLRSMHAGAGLGPAWRGLVILAGVTLLLLPATGVWMWLLRRVARQRRVRLVSMQGAGE